LQNILSPLPEEVIENFICKEIEYYFVSNTGAGGLEVEFGMIDFIGNLKSDAARNLSTVPQWPTPAFEYLDMYPKIKEQLLSLPRKTRVFTDTCSNFVIKIFEEIELMLTESFKISLTHVPSIRNRQLRFADLKESNKTSHFEQGQNLQSISDLNGNEHIKFWLKEFGLAVDFKVNVISNRFVEFLFLKNNKWHNFEELGFGHSQLIPLIIECCSFKLKNPGFFEEKLESFHKTKTLIVEEPESNLHPNLQSKLADFFLFVTENYVVQLIIETHSEYLIRKLQYLVAKKQAKPESISIYYFSAAKEEGQGSTAEQIKINADGSLDGNFGSGFFDEADNIALDLFLLKNKNDN